MTRRRITLARYAPYKLARCIEHDGRITAGEAELMRAVADILDCPMPPLLAA